MTLGEFKLITQHLSDSALIVVSDDRDVKNISSLLIHAGFKPKEEPGLVPPIHDDWIRLEIQ